MPLYSEKEIIKGCQESNRVYQEYLYKHYYSLFLKMCARYAKNIEDAEQLLNDSFLRKVLLQRGIKEELLNEIEAEEKAFVQREFEEAVNAREPDPATVSDHVFAATNVIEEKGNRVPEGKEKVVMVDAALHAVEEILQDYPEALFYGQDVGRRLGGVFREAATLADKFGDDRVFNTAIQEAYIIGSLQ